MILPPFNEARGAASSLQLAPPFAFSDVTMSVLPLRANLSRLQSFCNSYLNHTDTEMVFQPLVPYVYLILLNYGKMSVEQANMGWVSQHEVAFSIPLRFTTLKNGVPQKSEFAFNSPFIFVDNELSMTTGREVYGWPKMLAQLDYEPGSWVDDPHADRQVFQLSPNHGPLDDDRRTAGSPLITVYQKNVSGMADLPLDPSAVLSPLSGLPDMMLSASRVGLDLFQTAVGLAAPRNEAPGAAGAFPDLLNPAWYASLYNRENLARLATPQAWSSSVRDLLWSIVPRASANTVNLKQFRDASGSATVCYQALTNAAMQVRHIGAGGLLGPQNLLAGQFDGGYYVDIHDSTMLPVVSALGLQVEQQHETRFGPGNRLRPVCPFWMKVDMHYAPGDVLLWRSRSGGWRKSEGFRRFVQGGAAVAATDAGPSELSKKTPDEKMPEEKTLDKKTTAAKTPLPAAESSASHGRVKRDAISPLGNSYNSTLGRSAGVAHSLAPDTTIRVMPLLADGNRLREYVSDYLDIPGRARYENWGSHVYVVVTSYAINRRMSSSTREKLAGREINIVVPVKCYDWYEDADYDLSTKEGRTERDKARLLGTAVVSPFNFVNDDSIAIVRNEVDGVPTLRSSLRSPRSEWMSTSGPAGSVSQGLLETSALVLPEVGVGAAASRESLLRIETESQDLTTDGSHWREIIRDWGAVLVDDIREKYQQRGKRSEQSSSNDAFRYVRALALEVLAGKLPFTSLTLKQFRDAWEPARACYQGLLMGRRKIERLHCVCEIEEPLQIAIARYPTQPIAKLLGLVATHTKTGTEGSVDYFKPVRPFWIHADISLAPSETVTERVGTEQWSTLQNPQQLTGWQAVTVEQLISHVRSRGVVTSAVRISYLEKDGDTWLHCEKKWQRTDPVRLQTLESEGRLDKLAVLSRQHERELMAHSPSLNHLDRMPVDNLGGFLDAKAGAGKEAGQPVWTALPLGDLAGYIGEINPATILDSLLSRQWGCPVALRKPMHKADFVLPVDIMGCEHAESLFPASERQRNFWPPSADQQNLTENDRRGTALQLREDVMKLVKIGTTECSTYTDLAVEILPDWFINPVEPSAAWSAAQWKEVEDKLLQLIGRSHGVVNWPNIIRPLDGWRYKAHEMHVILSQRAQRQSASHSDGSDVLADADVAAILEARVRAVLGC